MKSIILITLLLLLGGLNIVLSQSSTATYTAGNIPTNFNSYSAACNGPLTPLVVTIPAGATVTSVDVSYNFTAPVAPNGWMSEQRSQIYCAETGNDEGGFINGTGNSTGTLPYNRTGLTLANGVSATGTLTFQMRAYRSWEGGFVGCNDNVNRIDNNAWSITVYYTEPPPFPGGIGTSSNIALWLKADDGPLNTGSGSASTDGQATNTWTDNSTARTNDATDATLTAPTFRNNATDNESGDDKTRP